MRCRNAAAFTVIELLTAIIVLGILVVLLYDSFKASTDAMTRSQNKSELNQVVRAVLDIMSRDIERQVYVNGVVDMYTDTTQAGWWWSDTNRWPTNTAFFLSDLSDPYDPNRTKGFVNVGYRIDSIVVSGLRSPMLMRGDDPLVLTTGACASNWWDFSACPFNYNSNPAPDQYNTGYWKVVSDNVIGLQFFFYTNNNFTILGASEQYTTNWPPSLPWTGMLIPYSVGIKIWAIDSESYNRALKVDPTLSSDGTNIIINNTRSYYTRVFLPYSTAYP